MEKKLRDIPGVGAVTIKKLRAAGITRIEELATLPPRRVAKLTGMSEERAIKLFMEARRILGGTYLSAEELDKEESKRVRLTTGVRALDELLGGIEPGVLTEFVGEFGSGKTQLCHQLAVTVQLPVKDGGLEGSALYIDTERTFSASRIKAIAKRFGLNVSDVLRRIYVARVVNSEHQIVVAREALRIIGEKNVKLVIVDSLINHFRSEYPGREALAIRQQKLAGHLADLMRIAEIYDIPIVFTNQIVSSPDPFTGSPKAPAGGNVVAHRATYRILLGKKKDMRYAKIIDSPKHPEGICYFKITGEGVVDI